MNVGLNLYNVFLKYIILLLFFSMFSCRSYNIKPGMEPKSNEGVIFANISIVGHQSWKFHIRPFGDDNIISGILKANSGQNVYAIFQKKGKYEIFGIVNDKGIGNAIIKEKRIIFDVSSKRNIFIGKINIKVLNSKLLIICSNNEDDYIRTQKIFKMKFKTLGKKYSFAKINKNFKYIYELKLKDPDKESCLLPPIRIF